MSASFIAVVFIAAVLLVNWRLTLLVGASILVALVLFGVGVVRPEQPADAGPSSSQIAPGNQSAAVVGQPGPR